jgi:hypothetical protein
VADPPRFTYTFDDGVHRYDFPDEPIPNVYITIETPGRNHLGQLWGTVSACFGTITAACSQFNLLDQNKRVDFEKIAGVFDGQVPWHDLLLALVPNLLEQLKTRTDETERSTAATSTPWTKVKSVACWLEEVDPEFQGLAKDLVAPGCISVIAAPRGLGKSHCAHAVAVALTTSGIFRGERVQPARVLLLDRDNPKAIVKKRLRAWGATRSISFDVLSREECPPLTDPDAWILFPVEHYDVLIIDSLNSFIEGVTEKEGRELTKALAILIDIASRGVAVVVLHNCVKDGSTFKGRQDIADRVDILYEVRDATGFLPKGNEDWWLQLPDAGESAWADRASRRKGRTDFRLAFIPSKFRIAAPPEPFCLEISMPGEGEWTLADVTTRMLHEGDQAQQEAKTAKQTKLDDAAHALAAVIHRIADERYMQKDEAESFLRESCQLTRKEARGLIEERNGQLWNLDQITSRPGKPWVLTPRR